MTCKLIILDLLVVAKAISQYRQIKASNVTYILHQMSVEFFTQGLISKDSRLGSHT